MAENLFYEEFGTGKALTLLHGFPFDHTIWLEIVPLMENDARILLPDLRGHGKSPSPPGTYTMQAMAEDVIRLWDALKIEKSILAGHSMGGYVTLAIAKTYPERLYGLILMASHSYADSPEKKAERMETIKKIEKNGDVSILTGMFRKLSYNKEIVEKSQTIISRAHPVGVCGALAGMAERQDSTQVLSDLEIPALMIAGKDDQMVAIENSRTIAAQMKKPWLIEISQAGHLPMLEQTAAVVDALKEFIHAI